MRIANHPPTRAESRRSNVRTCRTLQYGSLQSLPQATAVGLTMVFVDREAHSRAIETSKIQTIALVGNHTPRQCGIATFSTDLIESLASEHPAVECFVVAMNDPGMRHAYPARVRF